MNATQIRGWLLQNPKAHSLAVMVKKERTEITCAGQSWAKLAATVEAMQPDRIEALNDEGKLIRAVRPADFEDDDDKPAPAAAAAPAGSIVPGVHDPETVRFELVARLLADAHRFATETAFQKMVDIVGLMGKRNESLERSLGTMERLLRTELDEKLAEAEEKIRAAEESGGTLVKDMVSAAAGSFFGGGNAGAAPSKPNGKG